MKKRVFCLALLAVFLPSGAFAFTAKQLKQMSTFLSNFTELGFFELNVREAETPDLIRFGIMHNYVNNFKTRIKPCPKKNCEHGSLVIDGKFVAESVKKYFGLNLKNQSVKDSDPPYHFDGKLYHFEGADGEAVYYAEVKQAEQKGRIVRMTGDIYNTEDESDRPYRFEAEAVPSKWNGKDTWTLLTMKTEFLPSDTDFAGILSRTKGVWRFDGAKDTAYIVMDGEGKFEAYYASGALEMSGNLEPVEEYEGVYFYKMRDASGKELDMGFFMDSDTKLHFGNDDGQVYIKDRE